MKGTNGKTEAPVVLNLHSISLAGVDSWPSLKAIGMETVDQVANRLNDTRASNEPEENSLFLTSMTTLSRVRP